MQDFKLFVELRERVFQYLKSLVPNWPDYVVMDMVYKGYKKIASEKSEQFAIEDAKRYLKDFPTWHGYNNANDIQWKLETIPIKLDLFEPNSQRTLMKRMGGATHDAPKNIQRHQTQAELQKKRGAPSQEPIIIAKKREGYDLLEGWHRTIEALKEWPEGYEQRAWTFQSI